MSMPNSSPEAIRPNVLVVIVDDMGWSDIGYHDSNFDTPNLDRLAAEGVKLDSFYVSPSCTPTRAQLMTGRYNYRIGMQDSVLHSTEPRGVPLEEPFLSNKLKKTGYNTAAIGKWHLGMHMPQFLPLSRGFDKHYGIFTGGGDHVKHESVSQTFSARYSENARQFVGHNLWEDGHISPDNFRDAHTTDLYTEKAVDYVHELSAEDKPWFLYLAFQSVHDPIDTAPHWYEQGKCANISQPKDLINSKIDWNNRRVMCGMMAQLDHGMKELRDAIEAEGEWENTVVIVFSDNGGKLEHGSSNLPFAGEKGQYWEGGTRVPAFISGGYVKNALLDRKQLPYEFSPMVHVTDIHSTILGLAKYNIDEKDKPLDGINQWDSLISSGSGLRKDLVINLNSHFFASSGAVRVGDFKLVKNPDPMESVIYSKVKNSIKEREAIISQEDLYTIAHYEQGLLRLQKPSTYLFNIVRNPMERFDGLCSDLVECSNLYDNPDFVDIRDAAERFFQSESKLMVPATFKWEDDGPLADPANFDGVWSPWRDANGNPLAVYYGVGSRHQYAEAPKMTYFASTGIDTIDDMSTAMVILVMVGLSGMFAVAVLFILYYSRKEKRAKYTEI